MFKRRDLGRARWLAVPTTLAIAALALAGCGGSSDASTGTGTGASGSGSSGASSATTQLNLVGYSTPKKAYGALTDAFAQTPAGKGVGFASSFAASGSQSRAVDSGQPADVVAFSTTPDMTRLVKDKIVAPTWDANPEKGMSSDSVVVFVVRKGNPKGIKDWSDLARQGISVMTPNPKTSGGARWNYLAAWAYELDRTKGDQAAARKFVEAIYHNVPVLDSGARGTTTTFAQRGLGDVLINWENEAFLILKEFGADKFEIVIPPFSILAEPPVSLVDAVVDKRGTRAVAQAYLEFLYTPAAQRIIAQNYYRPLHPEQADPADIARFPKIRLVTIDQVFGGWRKARMLEPVVAVPEP